MSLTILRSSKSQYLQLSQQKYLLRLQRSVTNVKIRSCRQFTIVLTAK